MSKKYEIDLKEIVEPESINLIPVFEYVAANNIELIDYECEEALPLGRLIMSIIVGIIILII